MNNPQLKKINQKILVLNALTAAAVIVSGLAIFFITEEQSHSVSAIASLVVGCFVWALCFTKLVPLWKERSELEKLQ